MGEDIISGWKFYIGEDEVNTDINTELELPDDVIDKARLEMLESLLFTGDELSTGEDSASTDISMDMTLDKMGFEELFNTIDKLKYEQYQLMVQDVYNYIRKRYNSQSDMIDGLSRNRFIIAVPDDMLKDMLVGMFEVYNIDCSDNIQVDRFIDSVYIVDRDVLNYNSINLEE